MARKKISKTDLQRRVARLNKKLKTVVARLERQQSDLAALQQRLDGLPQVDALTTELASQDTRLQKLAEFVGAIDPSLDSIVDELKGRTQAIEEKLAGVTEAQQGLELRTALLSREAEDAAVVPASAGIPADEQRAPADQTSEQMAAQVQALQASLEQQAHHGADLADRFAALEAAVGELAHAHQTLRQQADRPSPQPQEGAVQHEMQRLAQHVPQLLAKLSRVEEVVGGLDRRVAAQESTNRTLSEQAETLAARLQSLNADHRHRLDDLEQSLQAERERIGVLSSGGEQLRKQAGRLAGESQNTIQRLQQQAEQLHAQEAKLAQQRQHLDAAAAGHTETVEGLKQRLAALDGARRNLQETADSLGVQQARQSSETQELHKRVQSRSWLGLLILLLICVAMGVLFYRGFADLQQSQQAMQAEMAAGKRSVAAAADLRDEISDLRQELSRQRDSVATVAQSVDEIRSSPAPQLPAKVETLSADLERLRRDSRQQEQDRLRQQTDQEQLRSNIDALATQVTAMEERISEYESSLAAVQNLPGQRWSEAQKSGRRYTLQLAGFRRPESLAWFVKRHNIGVDSAVMHTQYKGKPWSVVFYGIYENVAQAKAAAAQLPASLAANRPWVREIPRGGDLSPL